MTEAGWAAPAPRPEVDGDGSAKSRRPRFLTLRRLLRNPSGLVGASLVILVLLTAFFGPLIYRVDPLYINAGDRLSFASTGYPLGTDALGRDILARIVFGAQTTLIVGLVSVTASVIIGSAIGIVAAYYGGRIDNILMRLVDMAFAFPAILLALLIITILGPATINLIIAITLVFTPSFARVARTPAMEVMAAPYVELLRSVGVPSGRIMLRHVLPNSLAPIIVQATVTTSYAILIGAALSFLGLGVPPPAPSWGGMISDGQTYLGIAPWISLFPAVALFIAISGFNLMGDALRDVLDIRSF